MMEVVLAVVLTEDMAVVLTEDMVVVLTEDMVVALTVVVDMEELLQIQLVEDIVPMKAVLLLLQQTRLAL
jgi:hypothetical protein